MTRKATTSIPAAKRNADLLLSGIRTTSKDLPKQVIAKPVDSKLNSTMKQPEDPEPTNKLST